MDSGLLIVIMVGVEYGALHIDWDRPIAAQGIRIIPEVLGFDQYSSNSSNL